MKPSMLSRDLDGLTRQFTNQFGDFQPRRRACTSYLGASFFTS